MLHDETRSLTTHQQMFCFPNFDPCCHTLATFRNHAQFGLGDEEEPRSDEEAEPQVTRSTSLRNLQLHGIGLGLL